MDQPFIDFNDLAAQLAFAVQGFFVLFLVISPVMGYLMARQIANRTNQVIVWSVMVLLLNGVMMGGYVILRDHIPDEYLADWMLAALTSVGGASSSILVGKYLRWWLEPPGPSEFEREFAQMKPEDMSPIDIRRQQEIERRHRIRGG